MAKRKVVNKVVVDKNAAQFMRTAQNLARKGKTNKKLQEISNTMERASAKTRTIQRKLKNVEALPIGDEEEFYGSDLLDSLPSPDNVVDNSDYNVNEEE